MTAHIRKRFGSMGKLKIPRSRDGNGEVRRRILDRNTSNPPPIICSAGVRLKIEDAVPVALPDETTHQFEGLGSMADNRFYASVKEQTAEIIPAVW